MALTRRAWLALSVARIAWTQDDAVFRSSVSLVRVDVDVSDASGRTLGELKKEDFRIAEDGKEQPITGFSFDEEPLDLILLFDIGGNMRSKLLQVVRAVELGFHELRAEDRGCVMAFSAQAQLLAPFTHSLSTVNQTILLGVLGQHFGGSSNLIAAVSDAARRFRTEAGTGRRRAILLVTDKPAGRQPGQDAAVRDLWQSDAVLSELLLADRAPENPDEVVEMTGGAVIASRRDPGAAFQESLRRLRRRYTLYYALPRGAPGVERKIRVELTPGAANRFPGARVSARTGYAVRQ